MPIDPAAVGSAIPGGSYSWDRDRIILYHLGVGAGVPQTDPNELTYTYEKNLKVLPSWGVIPAFGAMGALARSQGCSSTPPCSCTGSRICRFTRPYPWLQQ